MSEEMGNRKGFSPFLVTILTLLVVVMGVGIHFVHLEYEKQKVEKEVVKDNMRTLENMMVRSNQGFIEALNEANANRDKTVSPSDNSSQRLSEKRNQEIYAEIESLKKEILRLEKELKEERELKKLLVEQTVEDKETEKEPPAEKPTKLTYTVRQKTFRVSPGGVLIFEITVSNQTGNKMMVLELGDMTLEAYDSKGNICSFVNHPSRGIRLIPLFPGKSLSHNLRLIPGEMNGNSFYVVHKSEMRRDYAPVMLRDLEYKLEEGELVEELVEKEPEVDWEAVKNSELYKLKEKLERLKKERDELEWEYKDKLNEKNSRIAQLEERLRGPVSGPRMEPVESVEADGKVLSVEPGGKFAVINLGEKDGIKLGMRFEVFNIVGIKKEFKSKGFIEIQKMEDTVATGRVENPENTILEGDQVGSLIYDKNRKITFYVAGDFRKYTKEEMMAKITESGGKIVDEITISTDYIVLGERGTEPAKKTAIKLQTGKMLNERQILKFIMD